MPVGSQASSLWVPPGTHRYPETYGAAGDGTTPDQAAVQAAINAGGVCYLRNSYLLEGPLTVAGTGCTGIFIAAGAKLINKYAPSGGGSRGALICNQTSGTWSAMSGFFVAGLGSIVNYDNSGSYYGRVIALWCNNLILRDFTINGWGGPGTTNGWALALAGDDITVLRVKGYNGYAHTGNAGLRMVSGANLVVRQCHMDAGDDAFTIDPAPPSSGDPLPNNGSVTNYLLSGITGSSKVARFISVNQIDQANTGSSGTPGTITMSGSISGTIEKAYGYGYNKALLIANESSSGTLSTTVKDSTFNQVNAEAVFCDLYVATDTGFQVAGLGAVDVTFDNVVVVNSSATGEVIDILGSVNNPLGAFTISDSNWDNGTALLKRLHVTSFTDGGGNSGSISGTPSTGQIIMGAFADGSVSGTAAALAAIGANPATSYMSAYWGNGAGSTSWANWQSQALAVINTLKGHPGKRLASIGLGPHGLASMWSDMINSDTTAVSAWQAVAAAAVAAGVDIRSEWEYNSGTQSWATSPTQADFNAGYAFAAKYLKAAGTALLAFNPNDGVAINDNYAGQHPYTAWFTPGAVSAIFVDQYTGPNPSFPGGAAPCNGAPFSNFLSGPHVNLTDIENLALSNGIAYVGIGEWGAEGTGYDCAADVTATWNWALGCIAKGLNVILIVWVSGSWNMETHPNMTAQLKSLVAAGRANGTVA